MSDQNSYSFYDDGIEKKVEIPFAKRKAPRVVLCIFVVVLALVILLETTYFIQALGLKIACSSNDTNVPKNYTEIQAATTAQRDLSYSKNEDCVFDLYAPSGNSEKLPLVLYIHGGYYVGGDKAASEPYCRKIASEGYVVASINYTLAPKGKYPTALLQANGALAYLLQNADLYNIDANNVFIGGDSAGGHLSSMLGAVYTNEELKSKIGLNAAIDRESLRGVLLLCGYYNTDTLRATNFPFISESVWMLTGVKKFEDYSRIDELNTVKNATADYPAAYIVCGSDDPFYGQADELTMRLEELGVKVSSYLPKSAADELPHEFQRDFSLTEADMAFEILTYFLEDNVSR